MPTVSFGSLNFGNNASRWIQRAEKLGSETNIYSLAVFNNKLYGGTGPNGNLFEWDGTSAWIQRAEKLGSENSILSLVAFNGKLYGGTSPNGLLYEWDGTSAWDLKAAKLGSETAINALAVDTFAQKLYGGTNPNGMLFEWDGASNWINRGANAPVSDTSINSLTVFNGKIYGGTSPNGMLLEWNNANAWVEKAPQFGSETSINSLVVFDPGSGSKLYGGTSPNGMLLEWNNANAWVEKAPQLGSETKINSLAVYNPGSGSKIYGSTSPGGRLFEWGSGASSWTQRASEFNSEMDVTSLITFDPGSGTKLYGSTGTSGSLLVWDGNSQWNQILTYTLGSTSAIDSLVVFNNLLYGGTADGRLLQWDGSSAWVQKAYTLGSTSAIDSLVVFNNLLYGGTADGRLLQWDGSSAWVQKASHLNGQAINSLAVYNSKLYGGTSPSGSLFEWNGVNTWTQKAGQLGSETSINSLTVFNSKIYAGTSPGGRLFEWDSINNVWIGKTYILGAEKNIFSLTVYNGKLYGGTSPNGLLYVWDGVTKWVKMANTLDGQVAISALAVFNNKLYGSTQTGGYLFECSDSGSRIVPNFFTGLDNKWVYLTIVADYTIGRIDFYRNGTLLPSQLTSSTMIPPAMTPKYIGAYVVAGSAYNPYSGGFEELRISQTARDQNWIALSYSNEKSPEPFTAVSPEESIFFTIQARVTSKNGPVSNASLSGTLIYCIPGTTTPSYAQIPSLVATSDAAGVASVMFPGYTSTIGVYIILMRANHAGVYGADYYISTPLISPDPFGAMVTDYTNGTLTLVHRKDLNAAYPNSSPIGYNATFAMPIGSSYYRPVFLDSAGEIGLGAPHKVQLGTAKENPGVLLVFFKTSDGTYGLTYTPWGVSALGLIATFGTPLRDATNVITKTRIVNIESYTYEVKVETWKLGK
jgi:hypothetical protein